MITVTDVAAKKLREILNEQEHTHLRTFVQGGGCSGFQYGLMTGNENSEEFKITETDQVFESNGIKIVIDPISIRYLKGAEIDLTDNGGFTFKNPNAKSTCGCGSSFSTE